MSELRRKFKFSAERLAENEKTLSPSPWKLAILQCVTNKGQEVCLLWLHAMQDFPTHFWYSKMPLHLYFKIGIFAFSDNLSAENLNFLRSPDIQDIRI